VNLLKNDPSNIDKKQLSNKYCYLNKFNSKYAFNKDKLINQEKENINFLSNNFNFGNYNTNTSGIINSSISPTMTLQQEISLLKSRLREKEKILMEKELKIREMEMENNILRKEVDKFRKEKKIKANNNRTNKIQKFIEKNIQQEENVQNMAFENLELNNISRRSSYSGYENRSEDNVLIYPNIDVMSYEELLELQEKIGSVSKGFTEEEINKIPMINFKKRIENGENLEIYTHNEKCTICQFDYNDGEKLRQLSCTHIFHKYCLAPWLNKEKVCPNCKEEINIV